jgi:hypothetical protein
MTVDPEFPYYIDGYLLSNLDAIVQRTISLWDNLIIIDGLERAGKSTLAVTCACYLAVKLKREFNAEKVFFDIEELTRFAQSTREQVIIWDEAVLGGMGQQWASAEQMKLKQLLVTCGKYRHILIFIIPDFTILGKYFAVHRSVALLRVYSPDNISRGYFRFYNDMQKKLLYDLEKKGVYFNHGAHPSFIGRFTKHEGLIDMKVYEMRKDKAIQSIGTDPRKTKDLMMYNVVYANNLAYKVPIAFMAKVLKKTVTHVNEKLAEYRAVNALISDEEVKNCYKRPPRLNNKKFVMPGEDDTTEEDIAQDAPILSQN